jgi:hypothetical protein
MDVRFCESRNHRREAQVRAADSGRFAVRAPPKRASEELCFLLTKTYMDVGYSENHLACLHVIAPYPCE